MDVKAEKEEVIDLQDFVIGLVLISLISFLDKIKCNALLN
jgi:hypothetical protein